MSTGAIRKKQARAAVGFLLPAYSLYILIILIPVLATFTFTFFFINRITLEFTFVGLENYEWIVEDKRFWKSLWTTFTFVILAVIGNVGLGLLLAVLLNRKFPNALLYVFRLVFFLPVLVSISTVAFVWEFLYNTDLGLFNFYLTSVGLPRIGWLSDAGVVMYSVVIFDVWKNVGFFMIIFLAALQGVPRDLIDAANVDGANDRTVFRKITLPFISPVVLFAVTFATIGALQVFDSIKVLTDGGPGDATRSTVMYMIDEAFGAGDVSTGAVAAVILLAVIVTVTLVQFLTTRRAVYS
jgi:multiple sugar transport system permease protein